MITKKPFFISLLTFLPFAHYAFKTVNSPYLHTSYLNFHVFFQTWSTENGGSFNYMFIPYDILIRILMITLPEWLAILISYAVPVFLAYYTSLILCQYLFNKHPVSYIGAFIYTYSVYGQYIATVTPHSGALMYGLLPFFMYIFLRHSKETSLIYDAALLTMASIFLVNINLTFIVYLYSFLGAITLFRTYTEGTVIGIKLSKLLLISLIGYCLTNLPFYVAFIGHTLTGSDVFLQSLSSESVDWKSSFSSIGELFRLAGGLNFYYEFQGVLAHPNLQIMLHNPFLIVSEYLITGLAFVYFMIGDRNEWWRRFCLFLMSLFFVLTLMATGVNTSSPTSDIYRLLTMIVPLFSIFRDSYKAVFIINLLISLLATRTLFVMFTNNKDITYSLILCVTLLLGIYSYPTWSGGMMKYELISVPSYWHSIARDYQDERFSQPLLLPWQPYSVYFFTSHTGKNTQFFRPLFNYSSSYNNEFLSSLYPLNQFSRVAGLYGIDAVLVQFDVNYSWYGIQKPKKVDYYFHELEVTHYTK